MAAVTFVVNELVNQTLGPWCDNPVCEPEWARLPGIAPMSMPTPFLLTLPQIVAGTAFALLTPPPPAAAQGREPVAVALDSAVYVERSDASHHVIEPADRLRPGDRVVTIVTWKRTGPADTGFTVTNPLPRALAYQGSAAPREEVSVDGGRTWGALAALRAGHHAATAEDVTHVRWRVASPAPEGRIAYSAIVR